MTVWVAVDMGVPPSGLFSVAFAASADGTVIVGSADFGSGSPIAFRWTGATFTSLGLLASGTTSQSAGVSDDGTIVVGRSDGGGSLPDGPGLATSEAFRWTSGGGMVGLGFLGTGQASQANAISADGTTIVGTSSNMPGYLIGGPPGPVNEFPFVWTSGGGMVELGILAGDTSGTALAVSANGNVIAGVSTGVGGDTPVTWTSGGAAVAIPFAGGATTGEAFAVSGAGTVIAGGMTASGVSQSFLRASGTTTLLGAPFLQPNSNAVGISADGLHLVGHGSSAGSGQAWHWTLATGFEDLPALSGDTTPSVQAISSDGTRPVGNSQFTGHAVYWVPVGPSTAATMAELWFSNTGAFVDLTQAANRRKFISATGGAQNLGVNGELPFGVSPVVFLTNTGAPASFALNNGRGGPFAESGGSLVHGATDPPGTSGSVTSGSTRGPGQGVLGDYRSGNLYGFNPATYLDNGTPRKWIRRWRALPATTVAADRYSYLAIKMQTGAGVPQGTNPQVMLRWSDDGGHVFSNYRMLPVGRSGETAFTIKFNRLGATSRFSGSDRIFELSSTDPFKVALIDAEVDVS